MIVQKYFWFLTLGDVHEDYFRVSMYVCRGNFEDDLENHENLGLPTCLWSDPTSVHFQEAPISTVHQGQL